MSKIDASEIKSLVKKFKDTGKSMGYAFGLGAKPEDSAFSIDKTKKGNVLMNEMKGDKSLKKIGFGTLEVKGNELVLTQTKKVSGIERVLTKQLKASGVRYIVRVAEGGGEADGEGDSPEVKAAEQAFNKKIDDLEKKIDELLKAAV